jgi:hypothetical protein
MEGCGKMHLDSSIPFFRRQVFQSVMAGSPRIVNQNGEGEVFTFQRSEGGRNLVRASHICLKSDGAATRFPDALNDAFRCIPILKVKNGNGKA